jgi:hypothetical protein
MKLPADIAVYAEYSLTRKAVESGWNTRVFNRAEVQEGSAIRCDPETGVITLGPGVYHITGSSQVTYNDLEPDPPTPGWNTEPRPNGGYCRLRYTKDAGLGNEHAITVGTISNANMLPSLVDTYLDVPHSAQIVLEHQVGFGPIEGIYLQDDATGSQWHIFARLAIRRVLDTSTSYERSALSSVLCAAFGRYLADPEPYRQLYGSYLGVAPKFVPECDAGVWASPTDATLARILKSGVLRFGYAEGDPYVWHANKELAGLDWELGNALAGIIRDKYFAFAPGKGLRAQWVRVDVPAGGDPEVAKFNALHEGLSRGLFDVALSGQANISADPGAPETTRQVDWTPPTALLFTNILYTGRDGHDMSDLVGGTREQFIARVKSWPEVKVMCVSNAGPSPINSADLVRAINAAGGNATLDNTGTLPSITAAIADQSIHFSVGDAVASAWIGNQPGFKGLNLDIAASTQPLQTAQSVAAFTLRTG